MFSTNTITKTSILACHGFSFTEHLFQKKRSHHDSILRNPNGNLHHLLQASIVTVQREKKS